MKKIIFALICVNTLTACTPQPPLTEEKKIRDRTAKVNVQLGIAYLERNDVTRAKQKLLQALDQGPTIPETWYSMGYFLEATGNKKEAGRYYLKAVALAPKRGDVLNNYGTYLCRGGKYKVAIEKFIAATKDPDYLNTADAYENAGLCARKLPNDTLASAYFHKSIAEDPNRPTVLFQLADIHFQAKKYKKAELFLAQFLATSDPTKASTVLSAALKEKLHPAPKLVASVESAKAEKKEEKVTTVAHKPVQRKVYASKRSKKMKHVATRATKDKKLTV